MYAFVARQHSHGENWTNGVLMVDQQVAPECRGTETYAQNFGTSEKDAVSTLKKSKISYLWHTKLSGPEHKGLEVELQLSFSTQ